MHETTSRCHRSSAHARGCADTTIAGYGSSRRPPSYHFPPASAHLLTILKRKHRECLPVFSEYVKRPTRTRSFLLMTTLNVDVLSIVCDFLTAASDILSFSLTCSSLRPVANKRLLDSRTIGLTDSKAIRDFHSFLFADADARTPHVRALRLDLELDLDSQRGASRTTHQPDPLSTLIDILTSCPHLEHIELFIADWYSGAEDSRVIDTIATIPSLRSLSVYGSAMQALTLLRETCAPLRMAGIHFRNLPGECWHPAALESTLSLTRLAPTLEDLKIAYVTVRPEVGDRAEFDG